MDEKQSTPNTNQFIANLNKLDAGDKARLKRNAGNRLSEAGQALGLFYKLLPYNTSQFHEETFFLTATLFALAEGGGSGDLGAILSKARLKGKNEKGLNRRFENLLDADKTQLPFRLRQIIHLVHSNRVRVDWQQLLEDLLYWDHPDKFIQKKWARSYYSSTTQKE